MIVFYEQNQMLLSDCISASSGGGGGGGGWGGDLGGEGRGGGLGRGLGKGRGRGLGKGRRSQHSVVPAMHQYVPNKIKLMEY